jgi:hypothetical protein
MSENTKARELTLDELDVACGGSTNAAPATKSTAGETRDSQIVPGATAFS